jgi:hypothetical protein
MVSQKMMMLNVGRRRAIVDEINLGEIVSCIRLLDKRATPCETAPRQVDM